jgi:hypothetical protein
LLANDIIEASGRGTLFKIAPPPNCGWLAYVQAEVAFYQFQSSAWACLLATQSQAEQGTGNIALMTVLRTRQSLPARACAEYSANADLTMVIPSDDTIPQSTEGTEILTATITLKSTNSRVRAYFSGICGGSATIDGAVALFQDSGVNALFATPAVINGGFVTPIDFV